MGGGGGGGGVASMSGWVEGEEELLFSPLGWWLLSSGDSSTSFKLLRSSSSDSKFSFSCITRISSRSSQQPQQVLGGKDLQLHHLGGGQGWHSDRNKPCKFLKELNFELVQAV